MCAARRRALAPGNFVAAPQCGMHARMIKALERAIEKIKTLPEERQEYAATVLEQIAEEGCEETYRLSDDERRLVAEGLADLDAGRVVSAEDMARFWKRHRK
jgi:predicted transcriptional regulator